MLRLRELADGDAESVRRVYGGGAAADVWFGAMTADQALAYVREAARDPVLLVRGIEVDGELVGVVRLDRASGQLSYLVREDARGNGHATAAVRELLARVRPAEEQKVVAVQRVANAASGRVLAKAGLVPVRTAGGYVHWELPVREAR
ncbi:GNAT family N-acetyltransferase [Kitasatospora sp. Ki12]|uniref:GNAT family N-acetyltransferase n=1 Tax=Kitasatospora xanthocidica TaxID=83382 RepID=UPI0016723922|nr:GNAT family N-acetyltransferase [Kitasatospora xanthocidica]GHF81938.1 hypothetical protein GCM10018790_69530 [Kitasatospora xanthocidica]